VKTRSDAKHERVFSLETGGLKGRNKWMLVGILRENREQRAVGLKPNNAKTEQQHKTSRFTESL